MNLAKARFWDTVLDAAEARSRALPIRGRLEYRRASGGREGEVPHCKSSGTNSGRAVWDEECRLLQAWADKR